MSLSTQTCNPKFDMNIVGRKLMLVNIGTSRVKIGVTYKSLLNGLIVIPACTIALNCRILL